MTKITTEDQALEFRVEAKSIYIIDIADKTKIEISTDLEQANEVIAILAKLASQTYPPPKPKVIHRKPVDLVPEVPYLLNHYKDEEE